MFEEVEKEVILCGGELKDLGWGLYVCCFVVES